MATKRKPQPKVEEKDNDKETIAEEIKGVTNLFQFILVILSNPLMWICGTVTIVLILFLTVGELRVGKQGFYFKGTPTKLTNYTKPLETLRQIPK